MLSIKYRVATSWKSPGFFCCLGKSLDCVHKSGMSWKMYGKFSCDLPNQNVMSYNNWYLVIVQSHCWNTLHFKGPSESFNVLLKDKACLDAGAQIRKSLS